MGESLPPSVHPRIRGERVAAVTGAFSSSGSSPHTRGTPHDQIHDSAIARFIPAYAGNAFLAPGYPLPCPVHPRIRGERVSGNCSACSSPGSSPHTRGTLRFRQPHACRQRFIPAYAGNAAAAPSRRRAKPVHPRIRGERTSSKLLIYRMKSEPSDSTKRSGC